jgi:ADP-ribose 1''-phosphate phosphatase
MLEYRKGDLFSAEGPNTILVQACNCQGSWGAGIAKEFAIRYPGYFKEYQEKCHKYGKILAGMAIQFRGQQINPGQAIACLFTSNGYGAGRDSEKLILLRTRAAIECLLGTLPPDVEVHSPKINSGLFGVPWEKTEKILNECLVHYPEVKWVVWEL